MEADARPIDELARSFCGGVRDCAARLSAAIAAYGDDEAAFYDAAAEAAAIESACDEDARALRGRLVELEPDLTGVYLQSRDLLELLSDLDDVANAVEDAVSALASMEPDLGDAADALAEHAEIAASAAANLCSAVEAYVEALYAGESPTADRDAIAAVRRAERRCDDRKSEALAAAFAPGPSVNGLAVREVTLALDAVPNAVEDAADRFSFVADATP